MHLLTPTYGPFPEIAEWHTETRLEPEQGFALDLAGQSVAHLVPLDPNLLATRTLSKAHSLAGFRVGTPFFRTRWPTARTRTTTPTRWPGPARRPPSPRSVTRTRSAAGARLRAWTEDLAGRLRALGVRTFPTETCFFLADSSPLAAADLAAGLRDQGILVKPLRDPRLGPGFMRITTSLPEENSRFVAELGRLLRGKGGAMEYDEVSREAQMGTRGRAIVGMNVEDLLRMLNQAYASEWLAYYQYWLGAKLIKGPMKDAVAAELTLHATEELNHAVLVSNRIIQLGGTPVLSPQGWGTMSPCAYDAPERGRRPRLGSWRNRPSWRG